MTEGHTIGEVLNHLKQEFEDVSISKIRFLESEGLVRPGRSESGYRQFSAEDVERLRYVLSAQRDRYLPLRVIKEELARLDAGLPPEEHPASPSPSPSAPLDPQPTLDGGASDRTSLLTDVTLDRSELAHASGLTATDIDGLIAGGVLPEREPYDGHALRTARVAAELLRRGLEPRHLRSYRLSADREADRIVQLIAPLLAQRNPESRRSATSTAEELVSLGAQLHRLMLDLRLSETMRP